MHRIAYTRLTKEQIAAKLDPVAERGPASVSPLSNFAGQSLTIVTDGWSHAEVQVLQQHQAVAN